MSVLAAERMVTDGGGVIVNVSTHGSLRPHPSYLPYAAAKAGLNALTEGLAKAYGPTVRVNTLMPGPFLTDISKAWALDNDGGGDTNPFAGYALQRAGDPAEIVGAALFLMSTPRASAPGRSCTPTAVFPEPEPVRNPAHASPERLAGLPCSRGRSTPRGADSAEIRMLSG